MADQGYLIERYYNGRLHYWYGRPLGCASVAHKDARDLDNGAWVDKAQDAIWFADEGSACAVLAWCLGGVGRVAQHAMVTLNLAKAATGVSSE